MVSTSEKHQSFVGGTRVVIDREITTDLSTVIENWIKDFKLVQTGLQMKLPLPPTPSLQVCGDIRELAGGIGDIRSLPALTFCLPGKQEIFDIVPYPLDEGDSDRRGDRTWPKTGGMGVESW